MNHKTSTTIMFAGDTMIGRLLNDIILTKGYAYPWGNLLPLLKEADLRIVNLETTLTKSEQAVPKVFNYKSRPENVKTLQLADIDIVSLANNHSKDFDDEGLLETIETLKKANIQHVGAGKNIDQARAPIIVTSNGIKIGILGATDNEPTWIASATQPGTNYFHVEQLDQLLADIRTLKANVDIVVVSLHWGPNMRLRPTQSYIDASHNIIDAGADIIHGHSSHIFQGIEVYNDKLIMYDTGGFVDDYHVDPTLRNDWSFLFFITITKKGIQAVRLVPIIINNMQVNLATGSQKSAIINRMQELSQEFGTHISDDGIVSIKGDTNGT